MNTIPFKEKDVKEYLDKCIIFWRDKRDNSKDLSESTLEKCYIDAFQSVRMSLFGELLEK